MGPTTWYLITPSPLRGRLRCRPSQFPSHGSKHMWVSAHCFKLMLGRTGSLRHHAQGQAAQNVRGLTLSQTPGTMMCDESSLGVQRVWNGHLSDVVSPGEDCLLWPAYWMSPG